MRFGGALAVSCCLLSLAVGQSLDGGRVVAKKDIGGGRSVVVVDSDGRTDNPGADRKTGVYVVSGAANHVDLVLDIFSPNEDDTAELDPIARGSIDVHFHDDYGFYRGSTRYFYDLSGSGRPVKIRYGRLRIESSSVKDVALRYSASFGSVSRGIQDELPEHHASITITPRGGDRPPAYRIEDDPAPPVTPVAERPFPAPGGGSGLVVTTAPGDSHRPGGIAITSAAGVRSFYPVPVVTADQRSKVRSDQYPPEGIENDIGPRTFIGSKIWFANTFYDGEGFTGVGAVGSFDFQTRKFRMEYLPEIANWSGSAILFDGSDLWIGLMRRPEGADFSGGLLRYNPQTGKARHYDVPGVIATIDRLGDTIYCGADDGVYTIRGAEVTQLVFGPDRSGKTIMTARKPPLVSTR